MTSTYVNGGREWPNYDCWGLVRHAFNSINGVLLPEYSGLNADSALLKSKRHAELVASDLVACKYKHGAILAVVKGRVCEHVGICIDINGSLYALETDLQTGPRVLSLNEFIREHKNVACYASA